MKPYTKFFLPIIIAVLVIGATLMFKSYRVKEITAADTGEENICANFVEEAKTFCEECSKENKDRNFLIKCTAKKLILFNPQLTREVCMYFEDEDEQKLCFAEALRVVDLETSLTQCDLIEGDVARHYCRALTFRDMNKTDDAINECNKIENNPNAFNQCMALVLGDKTHCEKIDIEEERQKCIQSVIG